MRRAATLVTAVIVAAALWTGCTIWNDAELLEADAAPGTSSSGGSSTSSSGATSGCPRATIDTLNPGAAAGTGGDIEIIVAVKTIDLGLDGMAVRKDFGYDLDGVCAESCVPRATDGGAPEGELGRDNGTASVVAGLGINPGTIANESFLEGSIGILARVRNYNGQPNDDSVAFSLYRSTGVTSGTPNFEDPDQAWKIDTTDLKSGAGDDYTSTNESPGFVKDGRLVVSGLLSSKIPFNNDSDILLRSVSFTAELVKEPNGRWNARNAIGVGRWGLTDALQTIAYVKEPGKSDADRLCKNTFLFGIAKQRICRFADIRLAPVDDGRGATCEALSTAVGFVTVPARFGPKETPTREEPCAGIDIGTCD